MIRWTDEQMKASQETLTRVTITMVPRGLSGSSQAPLWCPSPPPPPPQKVGRPSSIHPHLIPGPPPMPLRSQTSESEGITDHIQGITDHIGLSSYKQWLNRVRSEHMVLRSLIFSLSIHGFTFQWGIILDRNDDARLQMYISQVGDLNEDGEYVAWLMTNKSRSHRHRWCHHRHIRDYHHQERDLQISSSSSIFLNMV